MCEETVPVSYDCAWCGESFPGAELAPDEDGELTCQECNDAQVCGDYYDRQEERRQMGLLGF